MEFSSFPRPRASHILEIMNPWAFSFSPYLALFFSFMVLVLVHLPLSLGNAIGLEQYNTCSKEFNCGNITGLTYPFWGSHRPWGCGHPNLHLYCHDDIPTIEIKGVEYRVLSFNQDSQTLRIARQDYSKGPCSPILLNTTLDSTLFEYAEVSQYVTFFYGCPKDFSCSIAGIHLQKRYFVVEPQPQGLGLCNVSVNVPVLSISVSEEIPKLVKLDQFIEGVIGEGFEVKLKMESTACNDCLKSKGVCGYDLQNQTTCFCKNKLQSSKTCSPPTAAGTSQAFSPPGNLNAVTKIATGISAGVAGIIVVFAVICCFGRRCLSGNTSVLWKKETDDDKNIETFVKNYESLAPKRYRYSEVKKMTNSFTYKLGEGGFGCVYKGTLYDGRPVAVKRLSNSKGNGQDFINEVASISRTSHVNIVILPGFCFERSRRALIYEFMPNGSLDKLIHNRGSTMQSLNLEWTTMYRIAVGIARGLEYLYRGCNTRIFHFDIKPHNILLDQDFVPKISDFGLAKLYQHRDSMVSMTQARGTAGYIAPEVFCRNFGGVSHKSDVYSYGMLVLEMVGQRKNIELHVSQTSQIYFPSWVYKQLQPGNDLTALGSITNKEEEETARKMALVSLWCIQPNPSDRPSIDKVVEMLEGNSLLLQIPPNPIIHSENSP